ncbi:MAG: hypothetical protein ACHP7N_06235 [Caulobacterales bacterium]
MDDAPNDDPPADQRRDALLRQVMKQPPESRAEFKARLKHERSEKNGREPEPAPKASVTKP